MVFFSPLSAERASAEGKACLSSSISCSELQSHNQASFVLSFTSWSWCSWDHVLISLVLHGCKLWNSLLHHVWWGLGNLVLSYQTWRGSGDLQTLRIWNVRCRDLLSGCSLQWLFWKDEEIVKLLVSRCLSFWRNRMMIFSLSLTGVRKPIERIFNSAREKKCSSLIALRNETLRFPPGVQGWMQQCLVLVGYPTPPFLSLPALIIGCRPCVPRDFVFRRSMLFILRVNNLLFRE